MKFNPDEIKQLQRIYRECFPGTKAVTVHYLALCCAHRMDERADYKEFCEILSISDSYITEVYKIVRLAKMIAQRGLPDFLIPILQAEGRT